MEDTTSVKYTLTSTDMDFTVDLVFEKKDFSLRSLDGRASEWTRLVFHKCSHCPLNEQEFYFCPLARAIDNVISKIHNFLSYEEVDAQVEFENRKVSAHITLQRALRSLLGLIIPTSGCPHTLYFRPMSRYHLPFADTEETIYRAASMFLLAQYFIHKKSGCIPTDLTRLETIYNNVHIVNTRICKRLREFCKKDSPVNAIAILDMLTVSIHSALKHDLDSLEPYFSAFTENIKLSPNQATQKGR